MKLMDLLGELKVQVPGDLLRESLTHSSYANEKPEEGPSNERLEFLGDAVLDLIISEHLFQLQPPRDEGTLSFLRSALVRAETLAKVGEKLELGQMLQLGRGERNHGGGFKASILADAFEAVIAAVYISAGLDSTVDFVSSVLSIPQSVDDLLIVDAKSEMEQWAQHRYNSHPYYRVIQRQGPDHAPLFRVEVLVNGHCLGTGEGTSKQKAEKNAARDALEFLSGMEYEGDTGVSENKKNCR